jgi:hypothetical protein
VAASRNILIMAGALPWLVFGCAAFRGNEIPQLGYMVKIAKQGSEGECSELASLFANQAALRINPYKPPTLPAGEYCDVTLLDSSENHDEVSLVWDWRGISIVVRQLGRFGLATPNDRTTKLAARLIAITMARYPNAQVNRFKVYSNPFFGP